VAARLTGRALGGLSEGGDGFVVLLKGKLRPAHRLEVPAGRRRIEAERALDQREPFDRPTVIGQSLGEHGDGPGRIGPRRHPGFQRAQPAARLAPCDERGTEDGMRLAERRIQRERARSAFDRPAPAIIRRPSRGGREVVGDRQVRPAGGELGIQLDRLFQEPDGLSCRRWPEVVAQFASTEHKVVGLSVGGGSPPVVLRRRDVQGGGDLAPDRIQNREHVGERPIVALGPDRIAGFAVDQPGINLDSPVRKANAAFEDVADVQLARDLLVVCRSAPVREARLSGDHRQVGKRGEIIDNVLGDALGKVPQPVVA
jgi:hypothetical protein